MQTWAVKSTSSNTAVADDIVLRQGELVRLLFRPMLVRNENDPDASVKGTFVYQKKRKADDWQDVESTPLTSIRTGQEYRLELKSAELLQLVTKVGELHDLHREVGIPRGQGTFVRARSTVAALSVLSDEELRAVITGSESIGASAIARLIKWATKADNFALLFEKLEQLEPDSLRNLNAALGMARLKQALASWREHASNRNESFWQALLVDQAFVLEQVFSLPMVVMQERAYVGGKSVMNKGGHMVDFLMENAVTQSVGLIEIKTPSTELLGSEYRTGVYNVHSELSGAVQQILVYRASLLKEQATLLKGTGKRAFHPRCIVVIGHAGRELKDEAKRESFELYRAQLADVEIVTYDELFKRTQRLVKLLETGLSS